MVRTDFIGKVAALCKMNLSKRITMATALPAILLLSVCGVGWWAQTQATAVPWLGGFFAATAIAGTLLAAFFGASMARNVKQPLKDITNFANTLAAGDLKASAKNSRTDEFGTLFSSISQLGINLRTTVTDVRQNAHEVQQGAGEISSGNLDLSQRTKKQAAALEETASSMEEMTATVRLNADNAKQANELAITASDVATKGGDIMGNVVSTMSLISDSSKKIADIISVIDSIAFQTNILALNAAVEAARAGEQGRGFAVVATEVRNLAQKSAAAAKEIKTLIDNSVSTVDDGAKLVDDAGKAMDNIVLSIKQVTDIMSEITHASSEQSQGIMQINQAITHMDEVTQQNAALVEQAAASAESLDTQAKDLIGAISIFKVGDSIRQTAEVVKLKPTKTVKKSAARKSAPVSIASARKPYKQGGKAVAVGGGSDDEWQEFK